MVTGKTLMDELGKLVEIPKALITIKSKHDNLIDSALRISNAVNGTAQYLKRVVSTAYEIQSELVGLSSSLITAFEEMPARVRQDILVLANHSWYLTLNVPCSLSSKVAHTIKDGRLHEVNETLCSYYEENFLEECEELFLLYPDRRRIIKTAFEAHQKEWYELSTPVLISQADGVCEQMTGIGLYGIKNKGRQLKEFVDSSRAAGSIASFLHPLEIVLPIIAPRSGRTGNADDLNRHAILHGESTNYATRVNSCKAMSLLAYVFSIIDYCKKTEADV